MSIPIHHPPEAEGLEPCAVQGPGCRVLTGMWTALPDRQAKDQVACCKPCSEACGPEEVLSKEEWFRKVHTHVHYKVNWRVTF